MNTAAAAGNFADYEKNRKNLESSNTAVPSKGSKIASVFGRKPRSNYHAGKAGAEVAMSANGSWQGMDTMRRQAEAEIVAEHLQEVAPHLRGGTITPKAVEKYAELTTRRSHPFWSARQRRCHLRKAFGSQPLER